MNLYTLKSLLSGMRKVVVLGLLVLTAVIGACSDDDDKDPITIRIFSYYANYSGTYVLNGGTPVALPVSEDKTELYYGEFTLADVNQVEVTVKTSTAAKYLAVRAYRDGVKVKEGLASSDSGVELSVTLTYTYDEEDVTE